MVAGTIPELISPTLIVQSWRTVNSHHNDPDSILIMPFTAIGNEGQVELDTMLKSATKRRRIRFMENEEHKIQPSQQKHQPGTRFQIPMFGLSLPERTIRSTSAVVSGAVHESAELLLPQAFRSSKSYDLLVKQMLNFLAHDVGGVRRDAAPLAEGANVEVMSPAKPWVVLWTWLPARCCTFRQ